MIDTTHLMPGLAIGSKPPTGPAVASAGYTHVVLCASEYQPLDTQFPRATVLRAPFEDRPFRIQPGAQKTAIAAAEQVAKLVHGGNICLVTCMEGRNRSGLVCGLALVELGMPASQAENLICTRRVGALSNTDFKTLLLSARKA